MIKKIQDFFPDLKTLHGISLFDDKYGVDIWNVLDGIELMIDEFFKNGLPESSVSLSEQDILSWGLSPLAKKNEGFFVERSIKIDKPIYIEPFKIFVGSGTVLEASAVVKGPCVIGDDCEVRQGAYLRGNVVAGGHCTLGHTTEIKNSILMNHTEVGHFNYIGDSILGSHVNLGAGSKLANLQFRTVEEKQLPIDEIRTIRIPYENDYIDTERVKLGSILGDYVELGCNAVLCPGTLIGRDNWVSPNSTMQKGYYPPGQDKKKPLEKK